MLIWHWNCIFHGLRAGRDPMKKRSRQYPDIHMKDTGVVMKTRRVMKSARGLLWALAMLGGSAVLAEDLTLPLISAARDGQEERVAQLLAQGAGVNAANAQGKTALMSAAYFGNLRVVELLLAEGADVAAVDSDGMTALIAAAQGGHPEVVESLLLRGADIKAKTKSGITAMSSAELAGHTAVVELLNKASGEGDTKKKKKK